MTLEEAIKHAEEVAEEQEKEAKEWRESQVRKCEIIRFAEMDYTHENECKACAEEHRQLAEWLKDYKRLLDNRCQQNEDTIKTIEQEPKTWHWIVETGDRETGYGGCTMCSECSGEGDTEMDYCPNCGAKMVEPQESEDEE